MYTPDISSSTIQFLLHVVSLLNFARFSSPFLSRMSHVTRIPAFLSLSPELSHSSRHFILSSRQQITNPKYIISYPDILHPHGLISTSIGLDMRISSKFFEDGVLRISCVASISPTIWSGETVIQQGLLQQFPDIPSPSIDRREVMFLGRQRVQFRLFNFLMF